MLFIHYFIFKLITWVCEGSGGFLIFSYLDIYLFTHLYIHLIIYTLIPPPIHILLLLPEEYNTYDHIYIYLLFLLLTYTYLYLFPLPLILTFYIFLFIFFIIMCLFSLFYIPGYQSTSLFRIIINYGLLLKYSIKQFFNQYIYRIFISLSIY